jgi:hypothetical protein
MTDVDEFITEWEHSGPFTPRPDDTNALIAEVKARRSDADMHLRIFLDSIKRWHGTT